jgi:hypothetical protein
MYSGLFSNSTGSNECNQSISNENPASVYHQLNPNIQFRNEIERRKNERGSPNGYMYPKSERKIQYATQNDDENSMSIKMNTDQIINVPEKL